jgi:hypothetical protein
MQHTETANFVMPGRKANSSTRVSKGGIRRSRAARTRAGSERSQRGAASRETRPGNPRRAWNAAARLASGEALRPPWIRDPSPAPCRSLTLAPQEGSSAPLLAPPRLSPWSLNSSWQRLRSSRSECGFARLGLEGRDTA